MFERMAEPDSDPETGDFCPIRPTGETEDEHARTILKSARTVAILGAHHEPMRAAFYVPEYLQEHGYRIFPVNPGLVGRELFGEKTVASLTDLAEPIDIVDVFRRPAA